MGGGYSERMILSHLMPGVHFFSLFNKNNKALCWEKLVKK